MLSYKLDNPESTIRFGISLGKLLTNGMVICLKGDLGAGKTTLVKGIAEGLEIKEVVTSPTFTIVNEYFGKIPLYHIDTYRIESEQDLFDIGIEEYLPPGEGITVIEWPEILNTLLPKDYLEIKLTKISDFEREIRLTPLGVKYRYLIKEIESL